MDRERGYWKGIWMNECMNVGCTACIIAGNHIASFGRKKNLIRTHTNTHLLFAWWCFCLYTAFLFHFIIFISYNRFTFCCFCWSSSSSFFFWCTFCTWCMHFMPIALCFFPSFFHHIDALFIISRLYTHTVHWCILPRDKTFLLRQITFIYNLFAIFT